MINLFNDEDLSLPNYLKKFNVSDEISTAILIDAETLQGPINIEEVYCYTEQTKKCGSCNNEIDRDSSSNFCSHCDLENGAKPLVLEVRHCINCSTPFEANHTYQHSCLKCKPNMFSKLSTCINCSNTFVRNKDFQVFCDKPDCNEHNYLANLPKVVISWNLYKGKIRFSDCVDCGSHFCTLSEQTIKCSKCSRYGGDVFHHRTVCCQKCGVVKTTARPYNEDIGDKNNYCDSCMNTSLTDNASLFAEI